MHKTKRPLSFLLAVLMIVSMFAAVPFSASAATLTGTVDMSELQVDDVISNAVTITNNNSYSLKLTSGKIYCESWNAPFYMDVLDHDVVLTSFSFEINEFTDRIYVKDNNARDTTYSPLDKYGDRGGIAFVVSAVDPDTSTVTIESAPAYTVYWKNYNGNTIQEEDLLKGDMPSYSGETPAKPADAQYVYTFSGWAPEIAAVTVNVSYVAQFTASPIPADYASPAISGLWVGDSAEVTATGEISGTGGAGTASVSQEGDYIVLTLNNFSYSGEGGSYDNIRSSVVYTGSAPLIVRLIGTNVLTQTGVTSGNSFGFYTYQDADVRVEGPGELTVSSGDAESNSSGMYVSGALIVSGCTLNAAAGDSEYYYATNAGLDVSGDLTVENGANVTAVGGGVVGDNPLSVGALTFSNYDGCHNVVLKSGSVSLAGDTSAIYYSDASYRSYLEVAPDSTLITLKAGNTEVDTADVTLDDITNQKYIYAEATAKAAELPDAIKDCTYQYSYDDTILAYANVPFAVGGFDQLLTGAISFEGYGTEIALYDAKEYSYTFYTEAGTEIPAESLYSGSGSSSEMFDTSDDFTVYINAYNLNLSGFAIGTDVLYIVAEEPAAATPNDQQFVTIDDQISITLALDLGTRGKTTGDVTINREVESVQAADTDGVYNYKIVMSPAQIADEIVVTIGEETLTTSIKGYCETLSGDEYSEYAAAQNLAEAILEYGKAANTVFAYTDAASFAGIGDPDKTAVNAYTGAVFTDGTKKVTGASFMALTKPEFRFYTAGITEQAAYNYNGGDADSLSVSMDGGSDDLHAHFVKKADGKVLIEVTGVTAENMDKTITVTVTGLGTITFNGNAFAKAMAKSSNAAQQNLGAALYNYGVAANACFAD